MATKTKRQGGRCEVPAWLPPKRGATLRFTTLHGTRGGHVKQVNAQLHALSVFTDKNGEERIVTAEWFPTKRRWNYEVMAISDAVVGRIWPDGTSRPRPLSATGGVS